MAETLEWQSDDIIAFVRKGFYKLLDAETFRLIFRMLKLVYKLDESVIISEPRLFEEKITKLAGQNSARMTFELVADAIKKELAFTRIIETS